MPNTKPLPTIKTNYQQPHQQQQQQQQTYSTRQKTFAAQVKIEPRNGSHQQFRPIKPTTIKSSPSNGNNSSSNNNESKDGLFGGEIDINELLTDGGPKFLQLDHYKNFIPPIYKHNERYFIDDTLASNAFSKSKSRRNFAAHLAKLVFTPRERLESNCNGRFGKKALDSIRLSAIRNSLFKYYPCKSSSSSSSSSAFNGDPNIGGDHDENSVWIRDCIPAIDESNRVLKKQLIAWYKKNRLNNSIHANSSYAYANSGGGFDATGDDEQIEDEFEINI